MSRQSLKAKKTWRHRKRRSTFKRTQHVAVHDYDGAFRATGGPLLDLPALIGQVNRSLRGLGIRRE